MHGVRGDRGDFFYPWGSIMALHPVAYAMHCVLVFSRTAYTLHSMSLHYVQQLMQSVLARIYVCTLYNNTLSYCIVNLFSIEQL